jgi:pyruvate dehydrogenase E2 component (dihydrolipoamide acetyltransferase)
MLIDILMPALSPTMEEGTLIKWFVKEGDTVSSGDVIAEIETDKATMEYEVIEDGILEKILVKEGTEGVKVNKVIAVINDGESQASEPKLSEKSKKEELEPIKIIEAELPDYNENQNNHSKRLKASPLAKKIALTNNITLDKISGSGPGGRIVKIDLNPFLAKNPSVRKETSVDNLRKTEETIIDYKASINTKDIELNFAGREFDSIPINNMRKIIAKRLTESKQFVPHFYLRRTINVEKLINLRSDLNAIYKADGIKLSINDFIIKAASKSLQDYPSCNSIWAIDKFLQLKPSDIAVAVAIEDGLITPVLRDVNLKDLKQISVEMKLLAEKAKSRKLLPHEYTGASFAISNLGMKNIENFDAVINPPQSSILAVGSCSKKPVVLSDDKIEVRTMMSVTLSVDHRVIDGAVGANFLNSIVTYLETPLALIV